MRHRYKKDSFIHTTLVPTDQDTPTRNWSVLRGVCHVNHLLNARSSCWPLLCRVLDHADRIFFFICTQACIRSCHCSRLRLPAALQLAQFRDLSLSLGSKLRMRCSQITIAVPLTHGTGSSMYMVHHLRPAFSVQHPALGPRAACSPQSATRSVLVWFCKVHPRKYR